MGYRVVTVSPLKQFPIACFGLKDIKSLNDAKMQIEKKHKEDANAQIEKDRLHIANFEGFEMIREKHTKIAKKEIVLLEERWSSKIGPALDLHLTRQKRRQAHFESACRLEGCNNPRREKRVRGLATSTKARRPGARPLFCGAHVWLRKCLNQETLNVLHKSSANRICLV